MRNIGKRCESCSCVLRILYQLPCIPHSWAHTPSSALCSRIATFSCFPVIWETKFRTHIKQQTTFSDCKLKTKTSGTSGNRHYWISSTHTFFINLIFDWLVSLQIFVNTHSKIPLEGKGGRRVGLTTLPPLCVDCLETVRASNCWSPKDLYRCVIGLLYLYHFQRICYLCLYGVFVCVCCILLTRHDRILSLVLWNNKEFPTELIKLTFMLHKIKSSHLFVGLLLLVFIFILFYFILFYFCEELNVEVPALNLLAIHSFA